MKEEPLPSPPLRKGREPEGLELPAGVPRRHVAECASTNDLARAWAADASDPAPHGALVTADFQTQGRGRRGRVWDAVPGQSALMSFVLRPSSALADAWQVGFLAAVAVADALTSFGVEPRLKWPNDVLVGGNKIAGVLVEAFAVPPGRDAAGWAAIVGVGVNVNQEAFAHGESFLHPPTSLRGTTEREWPVEDVVQAVAPALAARVQEWEAHGFAPILAEWRRRLAVGVALRRGERTAVLLDVFEDGSARVLLGDGTFVQWASVEGEDDGNAVR